jgi:hypothetical protein
LFVEIRGVLDSVGVRAEHQSGTAGFGLENLDLLKTDDTINKTISDRERVRAQRVTGTTGDGFNGWVESVIQIKYVVHDIFQKHTNKEIDRWRNDLC